MSEEVKEHHLTKKKRLRLEAEARGEVYTENVESDTVEETTDTPIIPSRWYRVFNSRSALIHQTQDIDEAKATAVANGGTFSMI